jgi:hypothetical protein
MELLPNEQIIKQSTNNEFTLTNFRVVHKFSWWYSNYGNTIFLEDISSIERTDKGWIVLLIIGVLLVFFGVVFGLKGGGISGYGALAIGVLLVLVWWFSRRTVIRITPNGGKSIILNVSKSTSLVEDTLFNIELAKINRVQQLYNSKF